MKRRLLVTASVLAITILDPGCTKSRDGFDPTPGGTFVEDSGAPPDDGCPHQCSSDLRSVVRTCDGTVVETCPPNLACGESGCVDPCVAAAQAQSSVGCEFFMQPPPTLPWTSHSCYAAYLVNAQPAAADLRIEYRGQPMDLSGSVFTFAPGTGDLTAHEGSLKPGEGVVVFLADPPDKSRASSGGIACPNHVKPLTLEWPIPTERGLGVGASFRLVTNVPVTASTIYPFGGAAGYMTSATLLFPVAGWGKQHVLVGAWERGTAGIEAARPLPGMQIVAAEDDTEIVVRPTVDIVGGGGMPGALKGARTTYSLSRGQTLQIMQLEDPTGSVIESNKPTSVFGGHACMNIPVERCCCETAQQQLPAFEQWGREYVVVDHRPRGGLAVFESSPHRIVAAFDGTELSYDPAPPAGAPRRMAAGEVATFWSNDPFVVRTQDTEHPIYVAQYMSESDSYQGNEGDPEFVNVVPAGQYLNLYTFYADPTYSQTSLVVVRQKQGDAFKDVRLECADGNIPDFKAVGTEGRFEYALVDLTRNGATVALRPSCGYGLQRLRSDGPFATTLWGWDQAASYAYPGGMGQRKLVKGSLIVR